VRSRHDERGGVAGGQRPCGAVRCGAGTTGRCLGGSSCAARGFARGAETWSGSWGRPRHHGTWHTAASCARRPRSRPRGSLRERLAALRRWMPERPAAAQCPPTPAPRRVVLAHGHARPVTNVRAEMGRLANRPPNRTHPRHRPRIGSGEVASRSPAAVSRISRRRALLTRRCGRPPATARLRALSRRRREDAGGPVADTTPRARAPPIFSARGRRASPFGAVSAGARAGRLDWIGSAPHTGRGGIVHAKAASFFIPPRPAPRLRSKAADAAEVRHIPRRARAGPPVAGRPGIVTERLPAPPPPPALPYGWRLT